MKTCNKCLISKSLEEFHNDSYSKSGKKSICKQCKNNQRSAWKKANPDKNRKHSLTFYRKNTEIYKARAKLWRKLNPQKANWTTVKRRSYIKRATPSWANLEKIKEIYMNCPKGFHVDHVVPLRGKIVSGLHVESNLQYLIAIENVKKGNRYAD
jgi:hypothetical protein